MTDEITSYIDVENHLKGFPQTWYPALLKVMINASFDKQVWNGEDGFRMFIDRALRECQLETKNLKEGS